VSTPEDSSDSNAPAENTEEAAPTESTEATPAAAAETALVPTAASGENTGPLGQKRGVGFGILLFIVTLGIYGLYWAYKTGDELKAHTGTGIGGVIALVIQIVIWPVNSFVFPSEIGNMYARAGKPAPVSGWTGLWGFPGAYLIVPGIIWFVKVQGALNNYWDSQASQAVAPETAPAPTA